jgi:hypothetical protein
MASLICVHSIYIQEFGVPVVYDLGRTVVNLDWERDFLPHVKIEGVELSKAVRDVFEAYPGAFISYSCATSKLRYSRCDKPSITRQSKPKEDAGQGRWV